MLNVIARIRAAAAANAFAPALISDSRVITYSDLEALVARVSNHLLDRHLAPLTRIFINVADPDLRYVVMLAAMHVGMTPFVLLQLGERAELGPYVVVGAGPPHVADVPSDIVIAPGVLTGADGDPVLRDIPDRADDAILYIAATSGTTGQRKLVAETMGAARKRLGTLQSTKVNAGDRVMFTFGDATTIGVIVLRRILENGGANVRFPRDPEHCLRLINFTGVSELMTSPATASDLMDVMERAGARCPSVKDITLVGSLFQKRLIERIERNFSARLEIGYGTSETGVISRGLARAATFDVGYVGQPVAGVAVVSSATRANPGPIAVINRGISYTPYVVKGGVVPAVEGIINLPDIGFVEDGNLYLLGRSDEVFNASGNITAYSTIANDLLSVPGVADVGIVGGSAIGDFEGLLVAIVGAGDLDLTALRTRVAKAARASSVEAHIRVIRVERIPRNAMGKPDRDGIVALYRQTAGPG